MAKPGDYTLTLNIHLEVEDEFDADVLATMMGHALNEGINTNHPAFFAEMFEYALTERIRSAFRDAVEAVCQKIFKREMIVNKRGCTPKWCVETNKRLKEISRPRLGNGKRTVTITKGQPQ